MTFRFCYLKKRIDEEMFQNIIGRLDLSNLHSFHIECLMFRLRKDDGNILDIGPIMNKLINVWTLFDFRGDERAGHLSSGQILRKGKGRG